MPMNPEIKAQWTAALRSGEYEQVEGSLRTPEGYCCLGVLCDLAVEAGIIFAPVLQGGRWYVYGDEENDNILPGEVQEWAGISANPDISPDGLGFVLEDDEKATLAGANDNGLSFAAIADVIDSQL